jgi:hypothetical protein
VLRPDGEETVAEVAYDLTSLGADEDLERFAEGFGGTMAAWERLIAGADF